MNAFFFQFFGTIHFLIANKIYSDNFMKRIDENGEIRIIIDINKINK